jgi:hypothetical protein
MNVFIRGCHYGYDRVQAKVGTSVIGLEKQIREKDQQLKEFRRLRKALCANMSGTLCLSSIRVVGGGEAPS